LPQQPARATLRGSLSKMSRISQPLVLHSRINYSSHLSILIPTLPALQMPNLQTAIVCSPPPPIVHRLIFHLAFRTDADISHNKGVGRERDLQAWVASEDTPAGNLVGDDDTFGPGTNGNTSWDQFSANETLFGVKASFDEDVYTTKLDRSAPDFKERERKAQRIANEIIGVSRVGVCDSLWIFELFRS
jgi:hypothetical protein